MSPAAPAVAVPAWHAHPRLPLILGGLVVLLAALVFLPASRGEFVYDDEQLIVSNALIQDPRLAWTALTSDVFAYRAAAGEATSPYWRPTTMAWLIAMHRLFGVGPESTLGWHLGNIALHALVTGLAFALMRRLGMNALIAAAAAAIFAVHPTRTENVVWISGVPDLLVGAGMLGSILLALRARDLAHKRGAAAACYAGALAVYALALGSKEIAITLPAVLFFVLLRWGRGDGGGDDATSDAPLRPLWKRSGPALLAVLPFAALAAVYLIIRHNIVGASGATNPDAPGFIGAVRSAPLVGAFYLRQMFAPIWLGPTYPLRPVDSLSLSNFVLPLLLCLAAAAVFIYFALGRPRTRAALAGLSILILTAAPAAMAPAQAPELMVQDRYLYLPLLGLMMLLAAGLERLLTPRLGPRTPIGILAVAGVLAVPLAATTYYYSAAWTSNLGLWAWAVGNDPKSRFPWAQLGNYLTRAEMYDEAAVALDRALSIRATPMAHLARADLAFRMRQWDLAEHHVDQALAELRPRNQGRDLYMATDLLARIRLERAEQVHGADLPDETLMPIIDLYRDLRTRLPALRVMITDRIATILMVQSRPRDARRDLALAELESIRGSIAADRAIESRMALYRLGQLYAERGRLAEALDAFEEFLSLTEGTGHAVTRIARDTAQQAVFEIRRNLPPSSRPSAPAPTPAPQPGG